MPSTVVKAAIVKMRLRCQSSLGCVQTDATTPNFVATTCSELLLRVGSGVQTDATTPNNVGTRGASWEGYNP